MTSGEPRPALDPLAAALLPVLLHKLNNTTQLLSGFATLLAMRGGQEMLVERTDDLAGASLSVDELGWLLAVLASACGANLLLARREARGLEILVAMLRDALRREHSVVLESCEPLPQLHPAPLDGWQVPWAVGTLLWSSGCELESGARLTWHAAFADEHFVIEAPASPRSEDAATRVAERLPGAQVTCNTERWRLALPRAWVQCPSPPRAGDEGRTG